MKKIISAAIAFCILIPTLLFSTQAASDNDREAFAVNEDLYTLLEINPGAFEKEQYKNFRLRISADPGSETCTYSIEFQKDGYDGYVYGEYKAISYKEAFRRLKNNDYRSSHWDSDLSDISENDVLCELVYTDAIDLHYMMPCYKFYVEVKDEDQLTEYQIGENDKLYFFYYVPAVDMNENPETGETDPVAAAVCVVASAVLLAAAQINLKKFRKNT